MELDHNDPLTLRGSGYLLWLSRVLDPHITQIGALLGLQPHPPTPSAALPVVPSMLYATGAYYHCCSTNVAQPQRFASTSRRAPPNTLRGAASLRVWLVWWIWCVGLHSMEQAATALPILLPVGAHKACWVVVLLPHSASFCNRLPRYHFPMLATSTPPHHPVIPCLLFNRVNTGVRRALGEPMHGRISAEGLPPPPRANCTHTCCQGVRRSSFMPRLSFYGGRTAARASKHALLVSHTKYAMNAFGCSRITDAYL